jgi:hypothetical protein
MICSNVIASLFILEFREINDRGNPLRWSRDTRYPQKLALTSPTTGGRSVGIVRSRTKGTEEEEKKKINRDKDIKFLKNPS